MGREERLRLSIIILLLACCQPARPMQRDSLFVVFWNVENFFDWRSDGVSGSEAEFSAEGARRWSKSRFYAKCNAIAKTILMIGQDFGRMPDVVGFAEVENAFVMRQLLGATVLRKMDYALVHYDSPDQRGIDCALLYRKGSLSLKRSGPRHLRDSTGAVMATRDILVAEFDSLAVMVNHHPSKVGGKAGRRAVAMARMRELIDSLPQQRVLSVGDFNEDVWGAGGKGTIKYNGAWEKIDGCFSRGFRAVREVVYDSPLLTVPDAAFGGSKPARTYSGLRYTGGVSDHYPIAVMLYY